MSWKKPLASLLAVLILVAFAGCNSKMPDIYYKDIQIRWLAEEYTPETIWFDNDWLQKRSLAAAEGLDLTSIEGLSTYLDNILPVIQRYFARDEELTAIQHYDNGIWQIRFDYQPGENGWSRLDYSTTIYFVSEKNGDIVNYELWSIGGSEPWKYTAERAAQGQISMGAIHL